MSSQPDAARQVNRNHHAAGQILLAWLTLLMVAGTSLASNGPEPTLDRSPVDLAISFNGSWLATANQTSHSVSLVDIATGKVTDEVAVGRYPVTICLHPDGARLLVTCRDSGELWVLQVTDGQLLIASRIQTGFHPYGVTVHPDGKLAYVSLSATAAVAVIDLESAEVVDRIDVGTWPRHLAVSSDGNRMIVGTPGDRGLSHVDLTTRQLDRIERFVGLNIGHFAFDSEEQQVYFPWIVYRRNPITPGNIRLGWVLASRLGRSDMAGKARREAISLDPQGEAIADPHGIALTPDGKSVLITAGGSHELLVLQRSGLPFEDRGSTDHIDPDLLSDSSRFQRIELGGRPMGLAIAPDSRRAFVANYLLNCIQIVDLAERQVVKQIELGSATEISSARRGEAIFYDGRYSLDQWYSCHSCHYEGGVNAVAMDTFNDDSARTFKTVLPLYHLDQTDPWTWHGRQENLAEAVSKSITSTLQGAQPTATEVQDLVVFLSQLTPPPNPHLNQESVQASIARGRQLFETKGGCANCHVGQFTTDHQLHDLGMARRADRYSEFNTPTLTAVYERVVLLHDGRAHSLREVLTGDHAPENVGGEALSESELADLIAFLKTL